MCNNRLDINHIEKKWEIDFKAYFKDSLSNIQQMAVDGLITIESSNLTITNSGRLLARSICMQFDRYLKTENNKRFSRVI